MNHLIVARGVPHALSPEPGALGQTERFAAAVQTELFAVFIDELYLLRHLSDAAQSKFRVRRALSTAISLLVDRHSTLIQQCVQLVPVGPTLVVLAILPRCVKLAEIKMQRQHVSVFRKLEDG